MARPITQDKKKYQVARRKEYIANRRAVDPKLDRQLKDIMAQWNRRAIKAIAEQDSPHIIGKYAGRIHHEEKERRINKALAKSHARRKK